MASDDFSDSNGINNGFMVEQSPIPKVHLKQDNNWPKTHFHSVSKRAKTKVEDCSRQSIKCFSPLLFVYAGAIYQDNQSSSSHAPQAISGPALNASDFIIYKCSFIPIRSMLYARAVSAFCHTTKSTHPLHMSHFSMFLAIDLSIWKKRNSCFKLRVLIASSPHILSPIRVRFWRRIKPNWPLIIWGKREQSLNHCMMMIVQYQLNLFKSMS